MEINFEALFQYLKKTGEATISLYQYDDGEIGLIVQLGSYFDNGGVQVQLDITDLYEILSVNNITGEKGKIKALLKEFDEQENNESRARTIDKEIDDLIYLTLAKYLTQLVFASQGNNLYPEIVSLQKHETYFHLQVGSTN